MPLHGKIVVIKRSGGDGTEFPLAASCLFGRKTDCDIRIQLPQVSKEHCRIDLNENKEVIVTNLSSANPTCINGQALQQSERLKHGDVITIIDRSFRFEYPPAPTPKKRSSIGGKAETLKVLQDHQVGSTTTVEKRISDPHLIVGTNHDNIQQSVEKTLELEPKDDGSLSESQVASPFNDLYQMIKKSLDVKTPRKSSVSLLQTPSSKFCTPQAQSLRKNDGTPFVFTACKSTSKREAGRISPRTSKSKKAETPSNGTPQSVKKQRPSLQASTVKAEAPDAEAKQSKPTSPQTRRQATTQQFTVTEAIEQLATPSPKPPVRRRSNGTPAKGEKAMTSPKTEAKRKATPTSSEKGDQVKEMPKKRKSEELGKDLPRQQMKKKRVSFGGHLSPELFDKRLPPDSPLRKGATPRRSLGLLRPKESLLRRASVIGLMKVDQDHGQNASPKTPMSAKKSPVSKSASPKSPSPGKKSPSSKTASPKTPTSTKKSPASKTASPKTPTSTKKSPASKTASPKTPTSTKKSPASKTASPKTPTSAKKSPEPKTPTSAKKSPACKTASPKSPSPGKKSPASKTASPKSPSPGKKSPASKTASPKTPTSAKKSTASKASSPGNNSKSNDQPNNQQKSAGSEMKRKSGPNNKEETTTVTPMKTPLNSRIQTPTVQGRFSVSRISTPSPIAVDDVPDMAPSSTVTPKIPLRRKSMKSTTKKTPGLKSAVKGIRRSGISRVSMKAMNSWADIVKFGQAKVQRAAPTAKRQTVTKKTVKKVPSSQTPARHLKGHALASTGHANSPATIVVGKAVKQRVVYATGAAPKVVINTALSKKDMKMDEDMTGISEMFKTPARERERAVNSENSVPKTPLVDLSRSLVEPSVLNTPEEPGQMTVSPLTVKVTRYNSEAVHRLLNTDEEPIFVDDMPPLEINSDSDSEHQPSDVSTTTTTPSQKIELPPSFTGIKRILKTPKQKSEPVEDLRGKLLKTPKQKPEPKECLTGVKRIMKTPKQKVEPVEDIRGNLLKTPKQKSEPVEDIRGNLLKTPKQKSEPVEDIRGNLLKTPKQKSEPVEDIRGNLLKTPKQKSEPVEDIRGNLLKTPKQKTEEQECLTGVKRMMRTPRLESEPQEDIRVNLPDETAKKTESSPSVLLSGIKTMMKTPRDKNHPVEDMVGLKRLMRTPKEKSEPVEKNFGIKRLMRSPRLRGVAPVEDFEGLEELMQEPLSPPEGQEKTVEIEEPMLLDSDSPVEKELFLAEDPQDDADVRKDPTEAVGDNESEDVHIEIGRADAMDTVSESAVNDASPKDEAEVEADASEGMSSGTKGNTTDSMEVITQAPMAASVPLETPTFKVSENEDAVIIPDVQKKPVRGRRAKVMESKAADIKQQETPSEDTAVITPVRGRRGKKTEAPAPPAVRQTTRGRNTNTTESKDMELTQEENVAVSAVKPRRGNAKKETVERAETVQEVPVETEEVPEATHTSQDHVDHKANDDVEPQEKPVVKQGNKSVKASVPQTDVPEGASEVVPAEGEENPMDATEIETAEVKAETFKVTEVTVSIPDIQKKPVRGRRAKTVESKVTDVQQEVASEDPVVSAPVRGRRGKKTEASAPPAVRQTTRGRNANKHHTNANTTESMDDGLTQEESATVTAVKSRQGNAKKETVQHAEKVQEVPVETDEVPEDKHISQNHVDHKADDDPEPQEKPAQGRRTKMVESKVTNVAQEVASEDPIIPTSARGRRGKKTEVSAPPVVRQTTRGRSTKPQGSSDDKPEKLPENSVETQMVTDLSAEDAGDQPSVMGASPVDDVLAPPEEKSTSKPKRERKAKHTPVEETPLEPESTEVVNEQHITEDVQPELPVPAVDKHRRGGRKTKPDAGIQNEMTEDTIAPEETKQVSRPPARVKRGRNTQQEEKPEDNEPVEPVKKMRRTRKTGQDSQEPSEEAPTAETVTPEETVASIPPQPEKINEATRVSKPRRGARKAQEPESVTPVESTEVQEVPVVSSSDKPKRGRRTRQTAEEASVPEAKPECEPETEEKMNDESTHPVKNKSSRVRGVRTSVKDEVSEAVPAKRTRRGAAVPVEEASVDVTDVPEPAPLPVEPVKRGRRAAPKAKANTEETPSTDHVNATADEGKTSQRTVRWKTDCEVFEVTPQKTVRGRKLKSGDQKDMESNSASKGAAKTEEEDLSDQKSQPLKRTRRGAKITEDSTNQLPEEEQPKTRRGRSAKK